MDLGAIDQRFSRLSFQVAARSNVLAEELAATLTDLFRQFQSPSEGVHAIVERLRSIGHQIWSWDESLDWATWGDDYVHPGTHRLIVQFTFSEEGAAHAWFVTVEYGPWPKAIPELEKHCPGCGDLMKRGHLRIEAVGHGSEVAPAVALTIELSEAPRQEVLVGARSFRFIRRGWACPSCKGTWFPGTVRNEVS